jgi:hypothetical protein
LMRVGQEIIFFDGKDSKEIFSGQFRKKYEWLFTETE